MLNLRIIDVVQNQICGTEHMRKRFFLYTQNRLLKLLFIINVMDLLTQMLQRTDQKTASAAGKIQHLLAKLRINHVHHELGNGTRGIIFAGISGTLQVLQDILVNIVE